MNELIAFLKDIFMIQETAPQRVGLSQFKTSNKIERPKATKKFKNKEIKLSDLMRRN